MPTSMRESERIDYPAAGVATVVGPAAFAVDLGSGLTRIWTAGRGTLSVPTLSDSLTDPRRLVRRGRITDPAGYEHLLTRQLRRFHRPLPAGAVVVACRPIMASADEENTARQLLTAVFAPSRLLVIDTVRAAAIGAGTATATDVVLVVDVGAQLTEVAVLAGGRVAAARRADIGLSDLIPSAEPDPIVHTIVDLVDDLRADPHCRDLARTAVRRGLLLVGGGAALPRLAARTAGALSTAVHPVAHPRVTAVRGAGSAALAVLRHARGPAR